MMEYTLGCNETEGIDLTQIDEFSRYILYLFENAEKYCIFITSSDAHVPPDGKKRKLELFKSFGLKTDLQRGYRCSFLAVVDRGEAKVEQFNENRKLEVDYVFAGHKARIISQGFHAAPVTNSPVSINIDGIEYAVNKRGLNIVVWDWIKDSVIDSVVFDTFLDDGIIRRSVKSDPSVLCDAYREICKLSAICSSFACHYSQRLSENEFGAEQVYRHLSQNGVFLAEISWLRRNGIMVLAFKPAETDELTSPTEWEKICRSNRSFGFIKQNLDQYFEISGMSKIYSREIFEEILKHPVRSEKVKKYFHHIKQTSKYVNIDIFGQRPTESFPEMPYHTIYIFGDSIGCVWEMADCHTLTNQLQELVKDTYRVVNYSVSGTGFDSMGQNMLDVEFADGDIAVFICRKDKYSAIEEDLDHIGVPIIELLPYFDAPRGEEVFFDRIHPNPNGYKIISKVIADTISDYKKIEKVPEISGGGWKNQLFPYLLHIMYANFHGPGNSMIG